MDTATRKPRGYNSTTHREGCMCPVCRSKRGEARSTKKPVAIRLEKAIREELLEVAHKEGISLSGIIEAVLSLWMNGDIETLSSTSQKYFPQKRA